MRLISFQHSNGATPTVL